MRDLKKEYDAEYQRHMKAIQRIDNASIAGIVVIVLVIAWAVLS